MEYLLLTILLFILGGLLSFFSAIFDSISLDEIDSLDDKSEELKEALQVLQNKFEHSEIGLIIFEVLLYIFSSVSLTVFVFRENYNDEYLLVWLLGLLVIIFFQRTIYTGIAGKFNLKLAIKFNNILNLLFTLVKPISTVYSKVLSFFSGRGEDEAAREEINVLVETAKEDGYLDEDEYRLMKNIMHFSDVLVSDVMTPRTVIFCYEADSTIGEIINVQELQIFSRFPIWKGKSLDDEVVGYVVTKEILTVALQNKLDDKLKKYARAIHYIPENATLDDALEQFIKLRQHIFLVVDEYGGIEGLLSMEDLLENLLGVEIVDEADRVVDMRELAKQRRDKRIKELYPRLSSSELKKADND